MKVLAFSHIPLRYTEQGFLYPGGGWIYEFIDMFRNQGEHSLAIISLGQKSSKIEISEKISIYSIQRKNSTIPKKLIHNLTHSITEVNSIEEVDSCVNAFAPDIIQIFGTESEFGILTLRYSIPTVIHVQGILVYYIDKWLPRSSSQFKVLMHSKLLLLLRGSGLFHDFYRTRKLAKREVKVFRNHQFYFGRTNWDRSITWLYNPGRKYFLIDEMIREEFYNYKWQYTKEKPIKLLSTMNENLYKGLDFVLKTAKLLKELHINFEWNIVGLNENNQIKPIIESILNEKFFDNNIKFKGIHSGEKLGSLLANSSIYIHASSADNSPNSICEAMVVGIPVIATNIGGIPSLIRDGIDGILVPFDDVQMLAYHIVKITSDEEFSNFLSTNSIITSHKRHDKNKIKMEIFNAYRVIINQMPNN